MSFELVECDQKRVFFKKGEEIYHQHDSPQAFYYVKSGIVALSRLLLNGKEVMERVYNDEHYFGYRSLFSEQTFHLSAKALTSVEVCRIYVRDIDLFFSENSLFIRYLMSQLATELRHAEIRLSKMSSHCVELRVIDSMIELTEIGPNYNWTYREIASHCGCSTETVIRVGKKLRTNHLMDSQNNKKSYDLEKLYQERMRLAMG